MFPLHKAPRGLLELLRLRTGGEQPNEFDPRLIGVVEAGGFYGADILNVTNGVATTGAVPNLAKILTPAANQVGSAFRLRAIAGRLTVGAAAFTAGGYWEVGITLGPTATNVTLGNGQFGVAVATAQIGFGVDCDLVLEGRWSLYSVVNGTAAGADHQLTCVGLVEPYLLNS